MTKYSILTLALAFGASIACAAPAQENWDTHCAKCHGADGAGQSPMGKKLKAKNYTDAKALEGFTDAQLEAAIIDGVKKDGKTLMKAFKEDISSEDAKALVAMIRGMAKK